MYRAATLMVLAGALIFGRSAAASPAQQKQDQKSRPAKAKTDSMTGCVDEQNGHYVLTDDRNLNPIADLEAEGFPTEGFAKHVGQKVTVRGASTAGANRPLFRVRSIETVSDTCEPKALK